MSFDGDILKQVNDFNDIGLFLAKIKDHFINKNRIVSDYEINNGDIKLSSYLLDSGIGNIIRDLISTNNLNEKNVNDLILPYHKYAENLNFDIVIALDYALKYTYKKGERLDVNLKNIWEELANNQNGNLLLIEQTLNHLKEKKYRHDVYGPLHGFNFESFKKYGEGIYNLENNKSQNFDGYALGGIANTKDLKNEVWDVPTGLNPNQKSTWIVSKLCKQTKKQFPDKPLHVLGAGNIYALPFLTYFGSTSSDCHSPWRRSADGDSKIMIPLLDENLKFINSKGIFEYKKIDDISEGEYTFKLPLNMSINELKKNYKSKNKENYYLAQLVIFFHAINQYDLLIKFMKAHPNDYLLKLSNTDDKKFNTEYKILCDLLI